MLSVRRSLLIALAERYLMIVLQLISFMVLARLLTPEQIGLYSVSAAFIGLAQVVRDFGVGSYLIQEKELTDERKRTAFTITLIIGIAFFSVIQIAASTIGHFYNDQRMTTALTILAFNFLLIPFNSVTLATLRRDMKFNILFRINMTAAVVGTSVAVGLAALGVGYLSLIWSSVANAVVTCMGGFLYRRRELWLTPTLQAWRRVVGFGSQATIASVVTEVAMNLNDLVLGKVLGFAPVAILSRAQGVMYLFQRDVMGAIRNVAFPGFAKAHRDAMDMEQIHMRTVTALTAVAWPFYGFLALFSLEILRVLFGPQWDAAASLVPIFCLAGAIAAVWNLNLALLVALGRVDLSLRAELLVQIFRIASIVGCILFFGSLVSFATAFLLTYIFAWPVFYFYKGKALATCWPLRRTELFASFGLAITTLLVPALLKGAVVLGAIRLSPYVLLPTAAFCAALSWVLCLRYTNHPLKADGVLPAQVRRFVTR